MPRPTREPGSPAEARWTAAQTAFLGLLGLIIGSGASHDLWGAVSGAALGVLYGSWTTTQKSLRRLLDSVSTLQDRQADLERQLDRARASRPRATESGIDVEIAEETDRADSQAVTDPGQDPLQQAVAAAFTGPPRSTPEPVAPPTTPTPSTLPTPSTPTRPNVFAPGAQALRSFLFGGNTVVRVGLLVLLVGLTLLARYAAENALFPLEARLAAAALVGLALTAIGFRQRMRRPGFGLSLQGGGIAALYLVIFFAFRFYMLLPAGLAFALFVGLALATALLSVVQRAQPLLIIGSLGGFLAPVLASTGAGSHIALFGYYLLLNLSIAGVAGARAWRMPALVAFVCTYGVATIWGVLRYEEALFATTEPFVLAFLALFTAIAILHAWNRPPDLRGFVDATLVFGTPLVSLLLQAHLVRERELGLALSAAGFGLFYAVLATTLWRTAPRSVRPLCEAFVALAVGFGTMAIPFAFDEALTTSIAWSLEGAGLYWIGVRQSRGLPRLSGIGLQILASIAFFASLVLDELDSSHFLPIANGRALSCLALAAAGLFIAQQAFSARERLSPPEPRRTQLLGAWGLLWWSGGVLAEVDQFVPERGEPAALLGLIALTMAGLELGAARRDWEPGRSMALVGLPAAAGLLVSELDHQRNPLADGGWLAWPIVFLAFYFIWARRVDAHPMRMAAFRSGGLWLLALVVALSAAGLAREIFLLPVDWELAAFGCGVAAVLLGSLDLRARATPPFDREPMQLLTTALGPIAGLALLWILWMQLAARGNADPIPHLPLLNPVDVTAGLLGLAALSWWRELASVRQAATSPGLRRVWIVGTVGLGFVWLNGVLVRVVHQWTGAAFDPEALWHSVALQVCFSIVWTLVALTGMLLSSRREWRQAWMVCAGLLGVVVIKLFTVDLSQLSTVARIGTFLAVGGLLLVLGYLSPVPPTREGLASKEPAAPSDRREGTEEEDS